MGYPLHGHELSMSITPVEASASWAISWEKSFWGKAILQSQRETKSHRILQAIKIDDRGIPRAGMEVKDESGAGVGVVTSGTFSPTLKTGIALALLSKRYPTDSRISIVIRGRISTETIVRLPFVPSHVK